MLTTAAGSADSSSMHPNSGRGVGRAAIIEAIRSLVAQPGCSGIALSCHPANHAARSLYAALGFCDTGETAEDGAELVSRLGLEDARSRASIAGPVPEP